MAWREPRLARTRDRGSHPRLLTGEAVDLIYRSLSPGIWTIQVSGNGSLNLEPSAAANTDSLVSAPPIQSFEEIKLALDEEVRSINLVDIWAFCISPFSR